jgi:asparagine synthetase B (glutamine-hydrolysing)
MALGTLLNYFPRLLPDRFRPDPLVNATWARVPGTRFIDGRTFLEEVSILPRGSYTESRAGRPPRTDVYWDPRPAAGATVESSPEHPRELRRILIETLERSLDPDGRNLLLLSGGVDSSALGALAAGTLSRGLSSWSMIPAAESERFRELTYIDPLVARFGIEPTHRRELTQEIHRRWITGAPGLPFQILHPALCDLPNVCAGQEVRVLMSGMFADEVCGDRQRLTDWVLHTPLRELIAGAPLPFGGRDRLRWAKRRLLELIGRPWMAPIELDDWVPPEVKAEARDWFRGQRAAAARDRRPLRELAIRAAGDAWVAMYWEGVSPLGVRPLLPFFSREVLELAFRCHPGELLGPGNKRLLREALREDVPARNLLRPDPGAWTPYDGDARWALDGALPPAAAGVVRSDWISRPPSHTHFVEGARLTSAIRVAQFLERNGSLGAGRALRSRRSLV